MRSSASTTCPRSKPSLPRRDRPLIDPTPSRSASGKCSAIKRGPWSMSPLARRSLYLRRHLPDRWLAWCSGQGAGIGSTYLPREDVLRWFRPNAPDYPPGIPGRPTTLLTTDVTAEGLDLQGAGRVVHYDLPWTEVRIAQRDGRAVRRGSTRPVVDIVRFLPESGLEARLHQLEMLRDKAALPHRYGLGTNGRPMWRWRRELAEELGSAESGGHCCVASDWEGALAGVALDRDGMSVLSTVFLREGGGAWETDPEAIRQRLREAAQAASCPLPCSAELDLAVASLVPVVRSLLRTASSARASGVPPKPAALALGRRLRRIAVSAARKRDTALLSLLEAALRFTTGGHTAGEEMLVESLSACVDADLVPRLAQLPTAPPLAAPLRARLTGVVLFRPEGTAPAPPLPVAACGAMNFG